MLNVKINVKTTKSRTRIFFALVLRYLGFRSAALRALIQSLEAEIQ